MNLGISTASFYPKIYTENTIELISELEVDKIEVFLQTQSEYKEEYIKNLSEKIKMNGQQVYSVHPSSASFEPLLFSDYKREVDDAIEIFKVIFKCCKILGAKYYNFHGPRLVSSPVNQWPMIIDRMRKITDIAKEYDIGISQENVSWCVSGKMEFVEFLKGEKIENLYYTLDNKQAVKSLVDPTKLAKVMGTDLVNVHISDIKEKDVGIFPGFGNFEFDDFFINLKELKYTGPVFIEVYGKYLPHDLKGEFKKFKLKYF